MTQEEKIKFVLEKFPDIKSEQMFLWHYAEEFYGVSIYMLKQQFIDFWKEANQISGQILPTIDKFKKEAPTFTKEEVPSFNHTSKETEKELSFKDTLDEKDKEEFLAMFGDKDYREEINY